MSEAGGEAVKFSTIIERIAREREEHLARMESDPEYRAKWEASEAQAKAEVEGHKQWEAEQAAKRVQARREAQGLPERVIRLLSGVTSNEATEAVKGFMASDKTTLVLLGGTGCGKTVAACLALDEAKRGLMIKAGAIVRAGSFDGDFVRSLESAHVLVIDDLGVEPLDDKGWAMSNIAQLLDGRYDSCRKTIITSNLTPPQFSARYLDADGGRLRGRFRESGQVVTLGGKSLREAQP